MINNYLSTPPSYVINLIAPHKDFTAYMISNDKCLLYIGNKDNDVLHAERIVTIERSGSGWTITSDTDTDTIVDTITYPYYSYSTVQYGAQLPTAYHTMRTSYMTYYILILMIGICMYKCFEKLIRR